jgi:glycosyltransferase involved in cell wall biosynthesis
MVSAVIPSYNGVTRYLDEAVESVFKQTYRHFELIVVDDASTDETEQLVGRYAGVRFIRRSKNSGQAAARNEGARNATGRFLAFLDQDDLWKPTFFQDTLPILEAHPDAAVVHCDGYQINETGDILEYDAAMKHTDSITQMLRGGHDVATSGSLFRKTSFDAIGGYDEELAVWEDIDLAIRLFQRFTILHLPQPLYCHRLYGHNASRDIPSERALLGRRRFLEKYAQSCKPGTRLEKALKMDWAQYYGDLGKHCLRQGNREEAREAFRQAFNFQKNHKTLLRLIGAYVR